MLMGVMIPEVFPYFSNGYGMATIWLSGIDFLVEFNQEPWLGRIGTLEIRFSHSSVDGCSACPWGISIVESVPFDVRQY
jgi:hypothetical protein